MKRFEILLLVLIFLVLGGFVFFATWPRHMDQITPVSDLIDLQETLLKNTAELHPLLQSQLKELTIPLKAEWSPRYRFTIIGSEEKWTLIVAHDDSGFLDKAGFTLLQYHLDYTPHSIYILTSLDNSLIMVTPRGIALRHDNKEWH